MEEDRRELHFTSDYTVLKPREPTMCLISIDSWKYLELQIQRIESRHNIYLTIGSSLITTAVTAIGCAFGLIIDKAVYNIPVKLLVGSAGFVLLLVGILSIIYALRERDILSIYKENALNVMKLFEQSMVEENTNQPIRTNAS